MLSSFGVKTKMLHVFAGGGENATQKHVARGKMMPRDRVSGLLDPG